MEGDWQRLEAEWQQSCPILLRLRVDSLRLEVELQRQGSESQQLEVGHGRPEVELQRLEVGRGPLGVERERLEVRRGVSGDEGLPRPFAQQVLFLQMPAVVLFVQS